LELEFISILDFNLYIDSQEFKSYKQFIWHYNINCKSFRRIFLIILNVHLI
jgi:hypothetical protein